MEDYKLDSDEKKIERNSGYPIYLTDINDTDPFESDRNGFTRDSIAHNAYKMRMNVEYGPEDSFKAALDAVLSQSYYESRVDLFTCPQCKLCFVHPKRFLIHFKWHTFGLNNGNWRISEVTSLNTNFLGKKMEYCYFCPKTFSTIKGLDIHVKKSHGLAKLGVLTKPTTNDSIYANNISDWLTERKDPWRIQIHSEAEKAFVFQKQKTTCVKFIQKPMETCNAGYSFECSNGQNAWFGGSTFEQEPCLFGTNALMNTQFMKEKETESNVNKAPNIKKINEKSKIDLTNKQMHFCKPEGEAMLIKTNEEKNNCDESENERIQLPIQEHGQNQTKEQTEKQYITHIDIIQNRECANSRNETEEKRRKRLESQKKYDCAKRKNETKEERKARLKKYSLNSHKYRQKRKRKIEFWKLNETEEHRIARLERQRNYDRAKRQNETEEQKIARLERQKKYDRAKRQNETKEQKMARLERRRISRKNKTKGHNYAENQIILL